MEISPVFIEMLRFKGRSKFGRSKGNVRDTPNFLGHDC